jgi:hypothetical protein
MQVVERTELLALTVVGADPDDERTFAGVPDLVGRVLL